MKRTKRRRAGAPETLSVSVDATTMQALRGLADRDFEGSLSALVTDFAEEARRRMAAGDYLRRHRIPKLSERGTAQLQAELDREIAAKKTSQRRTAA